MTDTNKQVVMHDHIELKTLIDTIIQRRSLLIKSAMIAFLCAIFIVVFTPKVYKTEVKLLAESSSNSPANGLMGQLGSLSGIDVGSFMGFDMGGNTSVALTPDLYPEVVKSTTFLLEILEEEIYFPGEEKNLTVSEYLQNHTKPSIAGWPGYFLSLFKTTQTELQIPDKIEGVPLNLTQGHKNLIKALSASIDMNMEESGGALSAGESKIIKVSVELQDPYVSALLTEKVIASLKQYITDYHTSKEKNDLAFIKERYLEAQARYFEKQQILAEYDDSNVNIILASANTRRDKLLTETTLASNLYKSLAQKLEQAQILVQDKTPAFTVIEPAQIPLHKSKPKTLFTVVSFMMMGLFVATCVIIWKEFIFPSKNTRNS